MMRKWTRRSVLQGSTTVALAALSKTANASMSASDGLLELVAAPSPVRLYQDDFAPSDLWTYNGLTPGPEIRIRQGDRVRVRLINRLDEPTSIHWHGIRIDNAMDGVAGLTQDPVPPGGSFDYDFVAPDAGTFWYHSHNRSWNQVARGLYGPLIVDEPEPAFDRRCDVTLVIDDWRLGPDGTLETASLGALSDWSHGGRLGNWLTVNGRARPSISLPAGQACRLRLVNASNARILEIDPTPFGGRILAYDGQALPAPVDPPYAPLLLGPAQRLDLVVTATEDFQLEELSGDPFPMANFTIARSGSQFRDASRLPAAELPEPDLAAASRVTVDMTGGAMGRLGEIIYQGQVLSGSDFRDTGQMWAFNNVANLSTEPLFRVTKGESVVIETYNDTAFPHAMHVHGHHFRIIERQGSEVDEGRPWRDTFLIGPTQRTRVAFVADNPGKWLFHCHMLEHAAAGMNTWFEVV